MKTCKKCGVSKNEEDFYIDKNNSKTMARCKSCVLEDKRKAYHNKQNRTTKRKAKAPDVDLTNQIFGICTVIGYTTDNNENGYEEGRWLCQCECGNKFKVKHHLITNGIQTSCGCARGGKTGSKNHNWTGYEEISGTYYADIVNGALSRDLPFAVSLEDLWILYVEQDKKCALSGVDLIMNNYSRRSTERTASLDRIDSNQGYVLSNIQWIHKDINRMKNKYDQDYFIEICGLIHECTKK